MKRDVDKDVDRFVNHFNGQLEQIDELGSTSKELYKKLLYVSLLDAVARSVYPARGNRARFVAFVERFGGWSDCSRISLTHLLELLRRNPDTAYEKLRGWATDEFSKWPVHGSALTPINIDPEIDEVKKHWPSSKEHRQPIEGIALESLQHLHLLYTYRNALVHELRVPGYGMEFDEDSDPFYHKMSEIGEDERMVTKSIELVYPSGFFKSIASVALTNYGEYMKKDQLNPYDYYSFGTYWIGELNH